MTDPETSLEQRIAAAKATSSNYEDMAVRDTSSTLRERHRQRAEYWHEIAVALIAEKQALSRQLELLPT